MLWRSKIHINLQIEEVGLHRRRRRYASRKIYLSRTVKAVC